MSSKEVEEAGLKYLKEYYSKYLKMYYYHRITSLDDVRESLMTTYKEENKAFKLLFSFGYVMQKKIEKKNEPDDYVINLHYANNIFVINPKQL